MSVLQGLPHGALWAYRFDGREVRFLEDEAHCFAAPTDGSWTWAHFPLADQRARDFIARLTIMPETARAQLLGAHDMAQIHFEGTWTFGVLPDFESAPDAKSVGFGRLAFAFDDTHLFTTRRHALLAIDDLRRSFQTGPGPADPVAGVVALSSKYCDLAEDHVDELSRELDTIEDDVLIDRADLERLNLGPMRRDLSRRHREISALRTAFHRAASRNAQFAHHPFAQHLPALMQRTEDVDRAIAALQDRARLVHEEVDTKITSATNRTLRALTIISTLLMPPTLIVGAFGMNLKGILFEGSPVGFWLACGLCVASILGAFIVVVRMRVFR